MSEKRTRGRRVGDDAISTFLVGHRQKIEKHGRADMHHNDTRAVLTALLSAVVALGVAEPATAAAKIASSGRYFCDDGSSVKFIEAPYGPSMVRNGREVRLAPRAVFRGFSYKGEGLSVRGHGAEGNRTLFVEGKGLKINCSALPSMATPGVAAGTISPKLPMLLLPGAVLSVDVRDTAHADATVKVLGQVKLKIANHTQPLHWWLRYDPRRATHPARPALSARITDAAGKLLWTSNGLTPIPAGTSERFIESTIVIVPAGRRQ